MKDTVQIITGAGSGLGQQSAYTMASDGAKIVCADLRLAAAQETAAQIQKSGGTALAVEADVADWQNMQDIAQVSIDNFGTIDGLFANAGVPGAGSVTEVSLEVWDQTLAVNLTGAMLAARAVLPFMKKSQGGSILFTASISGHKGFPKQAAYAATKGAVIALARQMSVDYAPDNIRVNALCPGLVVTPLVNDLYTARAEFTGRPKDELLTDMAATYPLGRAGYPEDIASMAAFLQSDKASWITGQSFSVDGGMTA